MSKPVILTGLRANNDLHIGNYLGALLPMVDMARQKAGDYQVNLFVPDLHSFTTPIDHSKLYQQVLQNIKLYVAAGLPMDNPDVHVYRQSFIPAHSELTWILDCFTGFGEMSRMTQFKDKSKNYDIANDTLKNIRKLNEQRGEELKTLDIANKKINGMDVDESTIKQYLELFNSLSAIGNVQEPSVGLFNYPVLMAADILLYDAKYVPVGDDQTQHLEFTRDVAARMNRQFGKLFTVPEPVAKQHEFFGKDQGLRIRDLLNPAKKMSKSDETGKGVIFLNDTPEAATKKIMGAATDSFGQIKYDMQERPGISNLLQMLALFTGRSLKDVVAQFEGQASYGDLKKVVAQAVADFLADFQKRLHNVNESELLGKLNQSEEAMRTKAGQTLLRVQQAVGLRVK